MEAIQAIHAEIDEGADASDLYDEFDLPTFGGAPLAGEDGVFSWDAERVLVGDTITDAGIVSRADYLAAMEDWEPS